MSPLRLQCVPRHSLSESRVGVHVQIGGCDEPHAGLDVVGDVTADWEAFWTLKEASIAIILSDDCRGAVPLPWNGK